jgi:hypothetical protein
MELDDAPVDRPALAGALGAVDSRAVVDPPVAISPGGAGFARDADPVCLCPRCNTPMVVNRGAYTRLACPVAECGFAFDPRLSQWLLTAHGRGRPASAPVARRSGRSRSSPCSWSLLAMFAGLFVAVHGIEVTGWMERGLALIPLSARGSLPVLAATTTVLSNLVSNVPAALIRLAIGTAWIVWVFR